MRDSFKNSILTDFLKFKLKNQINIIGGTGNEGGFSDDEIIDPPQRPNGPGGGRP